MKLKLLKVDCREQPRNKRTSIKTRIHFFVEGENLLDNLKNRHSRPHTLYKKMMPQVIEQIKAQGIEVPDNFKFSWSQKARCKCGCSPGFITNWIGKEIYVTITTEE